MVGDPVDVHVISIDPPVSVANFQGTLASRGDVRHQSRRSEGEAFEFVVGNATFHIDQHAFAGGVYVDIGPLQGGTLEVRLGTTLLSIDWRADQRPSAR